MARIEAPVAFRVEIIESERGWGSKVDEVIYFDDAGEARQYCEDYNKKYNNEPVTPDWYMVAKYCGKVS
jgi:hypothetical protein